MSDLAERIGRLSPARVTLLALELQEKLDAMQERTREPIAVIGMACRLPGHANSPSAYWRLLRDGVDAVVDIPRDRWDGDAYYDPRQDAAGKMKTRWGGFIDDIDRFDAALFGIAPREAVSLDPQQRLLLETSWAALEDAGQAPDRLQGSLTGVFVGIGTSDYAQLLARSMPLAEIDAYRATGCISHSPASGRVAYVLGLQGPAVSVDTACSSSLSAVHLACQSLRLDECGMALAGGVNVVLMPDLGISLSHAGMMAADGRCKTFDASADGFVRGEGCGVVVLKRLSAALADRDRVLAVIRGTAMNQDGRSNGLTAPNGPAQEAVIRAALQSAGLRPEDISYVETHGTGTELGDPIELQALGRALRGEGSEYAALPLHLGAGKSNIGHLEAAAGVAGLIKLVLALQHRQLPPNLHFVTPNPHIPWDAFPFRVPTALQPWEPPGGVRIGGVSSFGFSGTNAHVVVAEAPPVAVPAAGHDRPLHLFTLSARTDAALTGLIELHARHLADDDAVGASPADYCFTANTGRAQLGRRLAVVAGSIEELRGRLEEARSGRPVSGIARGDVRPGDGRRVAMLFTGQGAQYVGMARGLYDAQPTFRSAIDRCADILRAYMEVPLLDLLNGTAGDVDATRDAQPCLFAVEYALAELWKSWGVEPFVVLGHSVGEYVAACVAGLFSLEDGLRLIAARGRLMGELRAGGAMAAVLGPAADVVAAVDASPGTTVAAFNGPRALTVAGDVEAIERLRTTLATRGISSQRLAVSHAFHSSRIEPMLDAFEAQVRSVQWLVPRTGIISNVSGRMAEAGELSTAQYWRRHAREAVRFEQGMQALADLAPEAVIEVGPHPTLIALGRDCVPNAPWSWVASLRRGREDWSQLLESAASLWTAGVSIDWRGFDRDYPRQRVALPTYPFERSRYWFDTELPSLTTGHLPAPPGSGNAGTNLVYGVTWERSDAFPDEEAAARPAPARAVRDLVAATGGALARRHDFDAYERTERAVDDVCVSFVYAALVQLGWRPAAGRCTSSGELADELGVHVRHRRLFERLLGMLAEDGFLERRGSIWRVLDREAPADARALLRDLRAIEPALDGELRLVQRCGVALASVLTGSTDPLPLLFPDGESADLEAIYGSSPAAQVFNGSIAAVVMQEARRATAPLRVLEIGAGTGSTTAHLFSEPGSDAIDYTFTDVSPYLVGGARQVWADRPGFRAAVLDIAVDPAVQGFDGRRFDVVVAANVLHATADLSRTLEHVRSLLAPGGMLVLYESVRAQRWIDLVFGLTEGWWKFTDLDLRPDSPLVTGAQWTTLLASHGFADAETWSPPTTDMPSAYALVVARMPELPRAATDDRGEWLIFADRAGFADRVAAALATSGRSCTVVQDGRLFERTTADRYTVRRHHHSDLDALFNDLDARQRSPRVVLWLRALDADLVDGSPREVEQAQLDAGMALIRCVVTLGARHGAGGPRLWLVTRGAQQPRGLEPGDGVALGQAPFWGWGRVARLEYPQQWGGIIDLPPADAPGDAAMVLRVVTAGGDEDLVAIRGGVPFVPRLRPLVAADNGPLELDADGAYLVTGGLGSIGLRVALWMADRGARHVALLGRSGTLTGERARVVDGLRRRGVAVHVVEADVADEAKLTALIGELRSQGHRLRGVVHAAGVVTLTPLETVTEENLRAQVHPKVAGAWALHRVTRDEALDFFVLCASAAGIWGSRGLGPYAAANQFLDSLAHYRRAQGLPALTVDWGRWQGRGLVRDEEHRWYDALGLQALSPDEGISALERLIRSGESQATVARVDWSRFTPVYASAASDAFLRSVTGRVQPLTPAATVGDGPGRPAGDSASPASLAVGERGTIAEYLQERLAQTLGLPVQDVPVDESVNFLGLDSLMAIRLRDCIQTDFGVTVSAADLLKGQTVQQLAERIARQVESGAGTPADRKPSGADVPVTETTATVDAMSEADVNKLLMQLLAEDRTHG